MHKETIEVTLDVPDGYELTGEYKEPNKDGSDSFIGYDGTKLSGHSLDTYGRKRFILRQAWTPPAWMPEGYWLYRMNSSDWFLAKNQPREIIQLGGTSGGFYSTDGLSVCKITGISRNDLPRIHCIQIKHAKT